MPGRSLLQLGLFGAILLSCQAATFTVTTTADSGAGSLRAAITAANAAGAGSHTITFSGVSGTITLQSMLPIVTGSVNIAGPGAGNLTISGNDQVRAFFIDANAGAVRISNLTIADGYAKGGNGADGGGGGLGAGGAIFINDGAVTLSNVAFTNNAAVGGDGAMRRTTGTPYGTMNAFYSAGGGGGLGGDGGIGGNGGGGGGGFGGDGGAGTLGPGGVGGVTGNGGDGHVAYNSYYYVVGGGGGGTVNGGNASDTVPGLGAGGGGEGGSSDSYHIPGTNNNGDAGARYGGGGGAGYLANGGDGGEFGGGGGGAPQETPAGSTGSRSAGDGGDFGGGGGASSGSTSLAYAGNGGFGGGGGGAGTDEYADAVGGGGGFGGGGGSGYNNRAGNGGAFGKRGNGTSGGGGAALGGNVFVRSSNGASLTFEGSTTLGNGALTGGWGGGDGDTAGGALFLLGGVTTFNAGLGETLTITGDIAGWSGEPAIVRKEGAGTLVLSGNNSWHGGTQLAGGVLSVAAASNLSVATSPLSFDGGTLRITGTAFTTTGHSVQLGTGGGTIEIVEGLNTVSFTSALAGSGALGKQGAGGLVFTDSTGFTGAVNLQGGALTLGSFGSAQLAAGTALTLARDTDFTLSGTLSGVGTFAKVGAGTLFLQADQPSFSGGFSVEGGIVELGPLARFDSSTITLNDTTLRWATGATADLSARLAPLGADGVAFDTNGNNVTLATGLHATGTFTKLGTGILALTGAGQFDDTVSVEAGTLRVNSATTFADTLAVQGATLELSAAVSLPAASLDLNDAVLRWLTGNTTDLSSRLGTLGTGGVTFDTNGNDVTFATAFSSLGTVTKTGAGTLHLTAANTRGTGTVVTTGAIAVDHALALQNSTVTVNTAQGLVFNGTAATLGALGGSGDLSLSTTALTVGGNNASTTYSGTLTGSATLTKAGTGQWTLTGNTAGYGGPVQVTGGTLAVPNLAALGSGQTTLNGGTLLLPANGATSSSSRSFVMGAAGGALDSADQMLTLTGIISGGNFEKRGWGTLTLTADNTYTNTLVSAGTLQLGAGGTTGRGGSGTYTLANGATLAVNRSDDFALAGALTGSGDLLKQGTAQLELTQGGTITGLTTIEGGSLRLGDNFATGSLVVSTNADSHAITGPGTLTLTGYGGLSVSGPAIIDVPVRSTAFVGSWNFTGSLTLTAPLTGSGLIYLQGGGYDPDTGLSTFDSFTLAAGSSGLTLDVGGVTFLMQGGQSYTSALRMGDGRLRATDTTPLVLSGVTTLTGYEITLGSTNPAQSGTIAFNTLRLDQDVSPELQVDSDVSVGSLEATSASFGGLTITKRGAGTLAVQSFGTNAYMITTIKVEEGVFAASGNTFFTTMVLNGGTLRYDAYSNTRTVTVLAGGGRVDTQGNPVVWTGALTGSGALTKTGSGVLAIRNGVNYTGAFTVANGTLILDTATLRTSRLTVDSPARLQGVGTVNGPVTLAGTFAPGATYGNFNGVGALTTGNLAFGATGVYEWEINDALGTAGLSAGGWDFATVNGTLSFASGARLSILSLGLDNLPGSAANFDTLTDYQWSLATATGSITGVELLTLDTDDFQNPFGGTFALSVVGNTLYLNYTGAPVPEPATTAAFAAVLALGFAILRRRRN